MWHVTYTTVIGELRFKKEFVAGRIGAGSLIHALDKNLRPLCKSGMSYNRSRNRFDHSSDESISCLRCLASLEKEKRTAQDWYAESRAEFLASIPRE